MTALLRILALAINGSFHPDMFKIVVSHLFQEIKQNNCMSVMTRFLNKIQFSVTKLMVSHDLLC